MRAIRIHRTGGPEVLELVEVAVPEPRAGEVLVRVEAAGVNFIDTYLRSGAYPVELPSGIGLEGAGVVEAVGEGVAGVRPGDRVGWANTAGSYAEQVLVRAAEAVPLPAGTGAQTAAAVLLQGMTAHYLVTSTFPLQPGHTALVHAAAGGVGQLLTQMAVRRGARVIGTASTAEKLQLAREAGASDAVDYTQQDVVGAVRDLTGGAGVDVVYDGVGRATFDQSLDCLRLRGMLVLYGQASGRVPPVDPQVLNAKGGLYLTRPSLAHYTSTRAELLQRAGEVLEAAGSGELRVRVDRTWPLADAAEAHRYIEGRRTKGKLLLVP